MELVFEIGCEDLPSRFVMPAIKELESNFGQYMAEARIEFSGLEVLGTPRRLVLLVSYVAEKQDDLEEERVGPPVRAAYKEGEPTRAAIGFAKGLGVDVADLYTVTTEKGEYVAAKIFEKGCESKEVLGGILLRCIEQFHFPKSMRWGKNTQSFARPIRWITAILNGERLPLTLKGYGGIESGTETFGHRFSPKGRNKRLEVHSIARYKELLAEYDVVLDPAERRFMIESQLKSCALPTEGTVVDDPALIEEVVNLVEKPHCLLLTYDKSYLELPDEVLITSMREHQRYFAIQGKDGRLMNSCLIIYNTPVADPNVVRDGNHRVLRARLDDAKFFWSQDLKHPLEWYNTRLESVTWLKEVGSVAERVRRLEVLAKRMAELLGLSEEECAVAQRAGLLSKADLVTSMVFEFTDLQGIVGQAYALKSGEKEEVAKAIGEQYLPKSVDGDIPCSPAGHALALADKLDALVCCFGVGLIPTATADPYALRRAAIGVVKILQAQEREVSLRGLLECALDVSEGAGVSRKEGVGREALLGALTEFIVTRFVNQLTTEYPTDVVQAVVAAGCDNLAAATGRVVALSRIRHEADFEPLAAGFKRVVNLVKKEESLATRIHDVDVKELDQNLFVEEAERLLFSAYTDALEKVESHVKEHGWDDACSELIKLKGPIDKFFDDVMVMVDDDALRRNRLTLLALVRSLFFRVGDLSVVS